MLLSFLQDNRRAALLGVGCALWFFLDAHCFFGIFAFLGGSALFFSYLSQGQISGVVSSAVTTICMAFLLPSVVFSHRLLETVVPTAILGYFMMRNIKKDGKVWWYPESFLLRDCSIIFYMVWIVLAYTLQTEDNVFNIYETAVRTIFPQYVDFFTKGDGAVQIKSILSYCGGIPVFLSMFETVFNLEMAYICKVRLKEKFNAPGFNSRNSFDFLNLDIPSWMALFPLVAFIFASVFPSFSYVLRGLGVVGLFAPATCGFSLIYWVASKRGNRRLITLFIVLTLVFPIYLILAIAMLGIINSFYPLRGFLDKSRIIGKK